MIATKDELRWLIDTIAAAPTRAPNDMDRARDRLVRGLTDLLVEQSALVITLTREETRT